MGTLHLLVRNMDFASARFTTPILSNLSFLIPLIDFSIPFVHLIVFTPLFIVGAWFGIRGVQQTTLQMAETHRPEKIASTSVYSIVRHPQYLGGFLAHVGISFLFSASYSLFSTPLIAAMIYTISWKEERELTREFGNQYREYKKNVPMFAPRLRR